MNIRVATYNIRTSLGMDGRHVWWLRRHRLIAVLRSLLLDLVALQEVRPVQLRWLRRRMGDASEGTFHGFTGTAGAGRIDHVLVDTSFHVVSARVVHLDAMASDHWPVVTCLRLS